MDSRRNSNSSTAFVVIVIGKLPSAFLCYVKTEKKKGGKVTCQFPFSYNCDTCHNGWPQKFGPSMANSQTSKFDSFVPSEGASVSDFGFFNKSRLFPQQQDSRRLAVTQQCQT